MAALDGTITFETGEYRPCLVSDNNTGAIHKKRVALFHRWVDIEQPTLKINTLCGVDTVNEIVKRFKENQLIPNDTDIIKYKCTYGLVEYDDGTVAEVEPCKIQFVDNKIKGYAF